MSHVTSIGFTGTRDGMTRDQVRIVHETILSYYPGEIHHGDCLGADSQFHEICHSAGPFHGTIHPPIKDMYRAFKKCDGCQLMPPSRLPQTGFGDSPSQRSYAGYPQGIQRGTQVGNMGHYPNGEEGPGWPSNHLSGWPYRKGMVSARFTSGTG